MKNPPIPQNSEHFRMEEGRPFVKLPGPGGEAPEPAFWGWTGIRYVVNHAPEYRPWVAALAIEEHQQDIDRHREELDNILYFQDDGKVFTEQEMSRRKELRKIIGIAGRAIRAWRAWGKA